MEFELLVFLSELCYSLCVDKGDNFFLILR